MDILARKAAAGKQYVNIAVQFGDMGESEPAVDFTPIRRTDGCFHLSVKYSPGGLGVLDIV